MREGFQAPINYDTPVAKDKVEIEDPVTESVEIKRLAKLFGADLVGITEIDQRWHYSSRVDTRDFTPAPNELPDDLTYVIVMGHAMDAELVDTYPSALAGASTGLEYSHETAIVIQLATYIRNLGYEAVASMNDTALVIPYAIKAGLGEYGRNQMVLTPEFGPRVRFSKIFTNLNLAADQPKPLGIRQYCDICTKCADACPGYWAKLKTDCAICMRVCPFNRRNSLIDSLWFNLATSKHRKIALWLDTKRGLRSRLKPKDWWARLSRLS